MYRAVKVVRREDFEYERTFEREFEGIQRYEKVSQNHPGLVSVLHVGRDDAGGFYYYAMELADSVSGEPVETGVESYRPRTLSSDLRRRTVSSPRECVDLGIALAEALGHLHEAGLIHRDVKPSNIIFVQGQPKLADVGLVATSGQRTFVGTEGYMPPEGPGTESADLYSLAMVLYEMHTGKDRLDFPELPTNLEIPPSVNRDEWRALNAVICRAGSPDPRKRFDSGRDLARALGAVCAAQWKAPEPKRSLLPAAFGFLAVFGLLSLLAGGGYWLWLDNRSFFDEHGPLLADKIRGKGIEGSGLRPPDTGIAPVAPTPEEKADDPAPPEPPETQPGSEAPGDAPAERTPEPPGDGDTSAPPAPEPSPPDPAEEPETPAADGKPILAEIVRGRVKITSHPSAARVYLDGEEIGVTETKLLDLEVGPVELVLRRDGYRDYRHEGEVREGTQVVNAVLRPDQGPRPGEPWTNSLGVEFVPAEDGRHRSAEMVGVGLFDQFLDETGIEMPRGGVNGVVQVAEDRALWQFSDWLAAKDRETGHLGEGEYYRPFRDPSLGRSDSFGLEISGETGVLVLNTEPSGAEVFHNGVRLGETPAVLDGLRLGDFELELHKEGYSTAVAMGTLSGVEPQDLVVALDRDDSPVFGETWTNSLGMAMVPVGGLLVASTETPSRSYLAYLSDRGVYIDPATSAAGLNFPAAGIGYDDAVAFCEWLTERERSLGRIRPWQRYRLPTDLEWSRFVGLVGETGSSPEQRSQAGDGAFPWGEEWPPPPDSGNFADLSASGYLGGSVIPDYTDGFETSAPVGSFGPSPEGLYDLAGNVWEWVEDFYSDTDEGLRVVRGGGWNSSEREVLAAAYRNPVPADAREAFYGFRYVLEDLGGPR